MQLSPEMRTTLPKVALPLIETIILLAVTRARRISWESDLGVRPGAIGISLAWIVGWTVWMFVSNAILDWRGPWDFAPWQRQGILISALRVLAVGFLGPIVEELLFRGLLHFRLGRTPIGQTRLGIIPVIVLTAAGWAGLHTAYSGDVIALLFINGLLLGAARQQTGSVLVPIAMHIIWNLYAVW